MFWVGSMLAVVMGHIALKQISRTGAQGHGLAVAGLVLDYVGLETLALMLLLMVGSAY